VRGLSAYYRQLEHVFALHVAQLELDVLVLDVEPSPPLLNPKSDILRSRSLLVQPGQVTWAERLKTSFSNSLPQVEHLYS
jgi:hypothetical protein